MGKLAHLKKAIKAAKKGVKKADDLAYQISHKPMTVDGGASTLDDLTPAFGDDIYGPNALQYFGSGDPREENVVRALRELRGNPDAKVKIYRGVPEDVDTINPGDWVTLDPEVAADYAAEYGSGSILELEVPASDVTSWADSLLEFGYHPKQWRSLESLVSAYKDAGIDSFVSERNGVLTLNKVVVPEDMRGQGIGSQFMNDLLEYADETGQTVALTPSTDFGGSSKKRLEEFYSRFGFAKNKGKNRDFEISEEMYRPPKSRGSTDPRLLLPLAAAGGAGAMISGDLSAAEQSASMPLDAIRSASEQFKQRRQQRQYTLQGLLETGATLGSGMVGGVIGDLSRLGGYLNPFMPVERTEAGAQALSNALQYHPSPEASPYLERIGEAVDQFEQDLSPLTEPVGRSIPGQAYQAMPERARKIVETGAGLAF